MPQPQPTATTNRKRFHARSIVLEGYKRDDGLWDIEGRLTDRKDRDYVLVTGVRPEGEALHDMQVRVTIDDEYNILAAQADVLAFPYPGCPAIAPDYSALVGLNLVRGFRRKVADLFGQVRGCNHVTELLSSFPTAAIQTVAGDKADSRAASARSAQLDRCHALDTTGETVRHYFPRWYREAESGGQAPSPSGSSPPTSKEEA